MIDKFGEIARNRHEYAQEWKAKHGGKVAGYFCTYVPEEVLYAAGLLPVRILGGHQTQDVVEPYIYSMWCPFCRDCLAQGLLGKYDYLDALIHSQSCMHIRQTFEQWRRFIPVSFDYLLYMPGYLEGERAHDCIVGQIEEFKGRLEAWLGRTIDADALRKALDTYARNRGLLRDLYELRKQDNPPVSGAQAMEIVLASQVMDKDEHSQILREALRGLSSRTGNGHGPRLMVVGSENDDVELIRFIESLGATVVVDDHCTGTRYFWENETQREDGIGAIAQRSIARPPCPQKDLTQERRLGHIAHLAEDYRVQGALLLQQQFCDPHAWDMPAIHSLLKDMGIPTLELQLDVTTPAGQIRTRVEAFLEVVDLESLP